MKTGRFGRLTDVAHALNFYDQSHFIRDIKAFSGVTPKSLSQKVDDFDLTQRIVAFV
jgi:AraC-like DNA-binding protein